jgi:hypothetical protein
MQILVQPFKNQTQNQFMGNTDSHYAGNWTASIRPVGSTGAIGAVDAMMKPDVQAVVQAYVRLIRRRGYQEFPAGEYVIELRRNFFGLDSDLNIPVWVS